MAGIYVHIPYCRRRCPYCDFVSEAVPGEAPGAYVDALCREIRETTHKLPVSSIFFGGGTPSLLAPADLNRLLETITQTFAVAADTEITLEANPDDVTRALVSAWKTAGINRISLGIQSFSDETLSYLGRRHDADGARRAIGLVAGHYDNWNMDLIFGAPPIQHWKTTLSEAVAMAPPHVAVYGLTYEPGTPFGHRASEALGEDDALALYQSAESVLSDYNHYEISNWAQAGYSCRHNLLYWHNEEYVGFGAGAYGFIGGVRIRNQSITADYICKPLDREEKICLSNKEMRLETVIQHFRLATGLPKDYYIDRFGNCVEDDFGDALGRLQERGLLACTETAWRPTRQGFYLNNEIGLELVG